MGVERLGVTAGCVAFDSSQSHEGEKCILPKPTLAVLGAESVHDLGNFLLADPRLEWHKQIRPPQVAVVLWNFVFQNQMVAKRLPSQFRDRAVVLVRVFMVKNEVWRKQL